MTEKVLNAGLSVSDRTRPFMEGRVTVPGYRVAVEPGDPQDIFRRALREGAFAICELSMSSHIVTTARGDARYYGLPVFLSRTFRHGSIFVRTDAGIETPADLSGRAIGVPQYQQTAGLWARGILRELYGVDTRSVAWRVGGMEAPESGERVKLNLPADVDVQPIGEGETLNGLVAAGKLDAIVAALRPSIAGAGGSMRPLFPNRREAEEDYYRATGFFPIMHVAAIRKDVADADPALPAALTAAFMEAKRLAGRDLLMGNFLRVSMPWVAEHVGEVKALMGDNPWRYGYRESAEELKAMARYAAHDGLTDREIDPAELFHPSTLDIADTA